MTQPKCLGELSVSKKAAAAYRRALHEHHVLYEETLATEAVRLAKARSREKAEARYRKRVARARAVKRFADERAWDVCKAAILAAHPEHVVKIKGARRRMTSSVDNAERNRLAAGGEAFRRSKRGRELYAQRKREADAQRVALLQALMVAWYELRAKCWTA